MNVTLNIDDVLKLVRTELEREKRTRSTHPYNAFTHCDSGTIAALEDLGNLIPLFQEDFPQYAAEVAKKRCKNRTPNYNPSQDKCNGDAWWIHGYCDTIKKYGGKIPDQCVPKTTQL